MDKAAVTAFIRKRLLEQAETCRKEMMLAQESANAEEKSSAGDKYETGRAMSQQQRDFFAARLEESLLHLAMFDASAGREASGSIQAGSLVKAGEQLFFIGSGLGLISLPGGEKLVCTTADSPLGRNLIGKKKGEDVLFAGKLLRIESLY
jgi:phage tail sheath gpL-like